VNEPSLSSPKGRAGRLPRLLRGPWFWALAALLTAAIWALTALALRPAPDPDGSLTTRPYGWTTGLEDSALDLLFQLREATAPSSRGRGLQEPVVLVAIDDAAVRAAGIRVPSWPRSDYARLVELASQGGATVIGLDLLLAGESGDSPEARAQDRALADALARAGNVVIAEKSAGGGSPAIPPSPLFASAAWATGFIDLPLESDGAVRNAAVRLWDEAEGDWQLSFAARLAEGHRYALLYARRLRESEAAGRSEEAARAAAAEVARLGAVLKQGPGRSLLSGERILPLRPDDLLALDFRGPPPAFLTVPALTLLRGESGAAPPDLFRDRAVLIAHTSVAGGDYFPTPYYQDALLPRLLGRGHGGGPARTAGVEIQATALATLLYGDPPRRLPFAGEALLLLAVLLPAASLLFRLRPALALPAVAGVALLLLAAAVWAFDALALVLPLATACLALTALAPAALALRQARERSLREETERERARVMSIFASCVSPEVADTLWAQRDRLGLAGERRVVTVLFTDIRDFTTLSESSTSDAVVAWLTAYFARMNEVVTAHGGHISKFIGDGLMIVFGAPLTRGDEQEARAAVRCGLAMLREVRRINEEWRGTGRPELRIGVGVHTGEATCGVLGSPRRLEYTVIGDTVNTASRLESQTKELGVSLVMSGATAALLDEALSLRSLGEVAVKGKSVPVPVFTLSEEPGGAP